MNNQKQQKPTLSGQRFKTRKRGNVFYFDTASQSGIASSRLCPVPSCSGTYHLKQWRSGEGCGNSIEVDFSPLCRFAKLNRYLNCPQSCWLLQMVLCLQQLHIQSLQILSTGFMSWNIAFSEVWKKQRMYKMSSWNPPLSAVSFVAPRPWQSLQDSG